MSTSAQPEATPAPAQPVAAPETVDDGSEPMANRKQYAVRNASSLRVVHTTTAGLTTANAKAEATDQLAGFVATHPEQTFEIVQA